MFTPQFSVAPSLTDVPVIDPVLFRNVLGRFASSVTILSARDAAGKDLGMTVSAFCSVSLHPPLVLFCVDHVATIHPTLLEVEGVGISILAEDQRDISNRFADKDAERFDGLRFTRAGNGAALIADAAAHLECTIVARHEGGDHTIFVAGVDAADTGSADPLLYYRGRYSSVSG